MLKRLEGALRVNAEQIRHMRAILAARPAPSEQRPGFSRKLKGLLAPAAPLGPPLLIPNAPAPEAWPQPTMRGEDVTLRVSDAADPADPTSNPEPIPPEVLLSGIAPRRPAFGQRAERVLELQHPAPSASQRLTLLGADGAAVGEIIFNGAAVTPVNDFPARRPFEPLHAETPFFPEDLADDPAAAALRARLARLPVRPEPPPIPEKPPPGMAAAFLLATLAARLASEDGALKGRLTQARVLA